MISHVQRWLEEQGFALEMRTASAFRACGFEVRQSTYYTDPDTGRAREIDVMAMDPDFLGVIEIGFVIECKSSKKPWALLCSPDTLSNYDRMRAFGAYRMKLEGP